MTWDEGLGASLFILSFILTALYLGRFFRSGPARSARVDQQGSTPLLNQFSKELGYWALQPGADFFLRLGFTPNHISWASLVLGLGAGFALVADHFGLAAFLSCFAMVFDVFDGMMARKLEISSDAGEVLDASIDRYVEFFFLGALVIFYRASIPLMGAALAAIFGSFMVSYSTAKAEAMRTLPPPTSMRRPERALLLVLGAALTAVTSRFQAADVISSPMAVAVIWLAVGTNVAAPLRLYRIAQQLRMRNSREG